MLWDVPIDSIEEEESATEYNNMVTPVKKRRLNIELDDADTEHNRNLLSDINNGQQIPSVLSSPYKLVSSVKDRCNDTSYFIDHSNSPEFASLQEESTIAREDVDPNAKVFLCVAWTCTKELELFKKFHKIIYCDVTGSTNNSMNFLLTFSGRTPDATSFIFLCFFFFFQRQGTFRWVFKVVLKNLFLKNFKN